MRLLVLDLETTGRDVKEDRITELAYVLWDTLKNRPILFQSDYLFDESYPNLTPEITEITGITDEILFEFGKPPPWVFSNLEIFCADHLPDFIVAHNGANFDKPMLFSNTIRYSPRYSYLENLEWIDSMDSIPFEKEPDSKKLKYMASDHGYINHFPHRALTDVMSLCHILSRYNIEDIVRISREPKIIIKACVGYAERQKAKDAKFRWQELGDKIFHGLWVKKISEKDLESEKERCQFPIEIQP